MAKVFRLATKDQTSTYDFLTGYLRPADRVTSDNGDGWVTETMTLVARTADVNILDGSATIDRFSYYCDRFWTDPLDTRSIWLEESADAEITKRSLIQSMRLVPVTEGWLTPQLGKTGAKFILTIIRSAVWEHTDDASATYYSSTDSVSSLGGTFVLPAILGSTYGRISSLLLDTGVSTRFWAGIRPRYAGTSDFVPLWELEDGTLAGGAALASDSDNASPAGTTDNIISYACSTADTLIDGITVAQVFGSSDGGLDFRGEFLVLLRAKVDANTARVHIRVSYSGSTDFETQNPYVYITDTNWHYYEMGTISIPTFPRFSFTAWMDDYQLRLRAMRPGDACTLSADCFVLIPSRHYIKVDNIPATVDTLVYVKTHEDGLVNAFSNNVTKTLALTANNWAFPVEGGVLVYAAEDSTGQAITDNVNIGIYYVPSFLNYADT